MILRVVLILIDILCIWLEIMSIRCHVLGMKYLTYSVESKCVIKYILYLVILHKYLMWSVLSFSLLKQRSSKEDKIVKKRPKIIHFIYIFILYFDSRSKNLSKCPILHTPYNYVKNIFLTFKKITATNLLYAPFTPKIEPTTSTYPV